MSEETLIWKKSSESNGSGGLCVETAVSAGGRMLVRDSKNPNGKILEFTRAEWGAFVVGVKKGEFDF